MPQGLQFGLLFVGLVIGALIGAAAVLGKVVGMREASNAALDKLLAHNNELTTAYTGAGQRLSEHERSLLDTTDQLRRQILITEQQQQAIDAHAAKTCQGCGRSIDDHDDFGRIALSESNAVSCDGFIFKQSGLWAKA